MPKRTKRVAKVHATALLVVLLVAGGLFLMRDSLMVSLANVTGQAEHHQATITSIDRSWHRGLTCGENSSKISHRISVQWEGPSGPREGSYGVCLDDDGGDYYVGQSLDIIVEPWTGAVSKEVSRFWSWFAFGVLGFVALILIPVGIISYVGSLRDAKDPDPRIKGIG